MNETVVGNLIDICGVKFNTIREGKKSGQLELSEFDITLKYTVTKIDIFAYRKVQL